MVPVTDISAVRVVTDSGDRKSCEFRLFAVCIHNTGVDREAERKEIYHTETTSVKTDKSDYSKDLI